MKKNKDLKIVVKHKTQNRKVGRETERWREREREREKEMEGSG